MPIHAPKMHCPTLVHLQTLTQACNLAPAPCRQRSRTHLLIQGPIRKHSLLCPQRQAHWLLSDCRSWSDPIIQLLLLETIGWEHFRQPGDLEEDTLPDVGQPNWVWWIFFFLIIFIFASYLFIWLPQVLVVAFRIFSRGMRTLNCSMWDRSLTRDQTQPPRIGCVKP